MTLYKLDSLNLLLLKFFYTMNAVS